MDQAAADYLERVDATRSQAKLPQNCAHMAPFAQMWGTTGNVGSILFYLSPMATVFKVCGG